MSDRSLKKSTLIEIAVIRSLVVLFQLIFLKLYSNYTSVNELGVFYFLLTASYSLNAFLLVPLDYFQQSQVYSLKNNNFSLKSLYPINAFVCKLITALLVIGNIICFFIKPYYCSTLTIITLLALSTYSVNLLRGLINNLEYRRTAIYCLFLEYVLKIAFFYIYIQFYKATSLIILLSLLSASIVSLSLLFFFFIRLTEYKLREIKVFDIKDIFKFSYPISISAVINWVQLQSYSLILVPMGLTETVGIYATVANVGSGGMNAYSTIFSQLFVPNIYKSQGGYLKTYLRNAILSIIFILFCSLIFSKLIIALLTKQIFVKYAIVILYGVACEGGNLLIGALTIYITIQGITKINVKVATIGLIAFLVSFFTLYLLHIVNVYTIGIPMIITQAIIIIGLLLVIKKFKKYI